MFQFPPNPAINQQFSPITGLTYMWDGTGWVMQGITPASIYPAGIVLAYAGAGVLPFQGWLLCDGKSYPTAVYSVLFAAIGYAYGGAGPNFSVPDLRGRVVAAPDNMGGTAANRLTAASGFGVAPGSAGGAEQIVLSAAQLAAHGHAISDPTHFHAISDPTHSHAVADPTHSHGYNAPSNIQADGLATAGQPVVEAIVGANTVGAATGIAIFGAATGITQTASKATALTLGTTGADAPHNNVQPSLLMNYIIKV